MACAGVWFPVNWGAAQAGQNGQEVRHALSGDVCPHVSQGRGAASGSALLTGQPPSDPDQSWETVLWVGEEKGGESPAGTGSDHVRRDSAGHRERPPRHGDDDWPWQRSWRPVMSTLRLAAHLWPAVPVCAYVSCPRRTGTGALLRDQPTRRRREPTDRVPDQPVHVTAPASTTPAYDGPRSTTEAHFVSSIGSKHSTVSGKLTSECRKRRVALLRGPCFRGNIRSWPMTLIR